MESMRLLHLVVRLIERNGLEATFLVWWRGTYRRYPAVATPDDGPLMIDGHWVDGPVELEQARHNVRLSDGQEPLFLPPADIGGVAFDMTDPSERKVLFPGSFTS